jgi:hypothetical protein
MMALETARATKVRVLDPGEKQSPLQLPLGHLLILGIKPEYKNLDRGQLVRIRETIQLSENLFRWADIKILGYQQSLNL